MRLSTLRTMLAATLLGAAATLSAVSAPAAEVEVRTTIPSTASEIWKAIGGQIGELKSLIAKGTLKTVHQHAYAVRDLVRALPSHSPSLTADARAKVSAQVKFVDTLATRLDASGDANDKPGTVANLKKLENILTAIRALYGSH